jgi:hypothetical protein
MVTSKLLAMCILALMLGFSPVANATLIDRGGGLIYDDDFNITWLQDAGLGGHKEWDNAMTWAENLSYYDSVRDVTYDDWRLPTALNQDGSDPDWGYNSTGSEMGHLYYTELLNPPDPPGGTLINTFPFINLQLAQYWSGTEEPQEPPLDAYAWYFVFSDGQQSNHIKNHDYYAWAVRPGDVVPEPATICLLGLGALSLLRRKRSA